jgi:transcription termination factor NusB
MKKSSIPTIAFALICASMLCSTDAQEPSQVGAAVEALKKQQTEIVENQTKLDANIAALTENIRLARLYMVRAGGKHKALPIPK